MHVSIALLFTSRLIRLFSPNLWVSSARFRARVEHVIKLLQPIGIHQQSQCFIMLAITVQLLVELQPPKCFFSLTEILILNKFASRFVL